MTTTQELDAVSEDLGEIEDLDEIEDRAGKDSEVHRRVRRLRDRRLRRAIRVSTAARLLGLSQPTVRAWLDEGILEDAGGSPRRVSLRSVIDVRPTIRELKRLGRQRNLLAAVAARLEDEAALADPHLQASLKQMRDGELIELRPPEG